MTLDQQFKDALRKALKAKPELVQQCSELISASFKMKLNEDSIAFIIKDYGISRVQAEEMWAKTLKFNDLLIKKYGDTYFENAGLIMSLTKRYQQTLIDKYKKN